MDKRTSLLPGELFSSQVVQFLVVVFDPTGRRAKIAAQEHSNVCAPSVKEKVLQKKSMYYF